MKTLVARCLGDLRTALLVTVALLSASLTARGEVPPTASSRAERASALAQLVRGTSTRADVEKLLGHAPGIGSAQLPPLWQPRDIWFYESIKPGKLTPEPRIANQKYTTFHFDMSQDILLVFFAGDLFDGYMWYTNMATAEARGPQD
jgi:hypothetical protein